MAMLHKRSTVQALAIATGLVLAAGTMAATVSLSPTSVQVTKGQRATLTVSVNPQTANVYTVKLDMAYPADILEVEAFTFTSGWMQLVQQGYDLIDNTNGILIKTAGFSGGVSKSEVVGKVVFRAKQTGRASVDVTARSLALDSQNISVMTGLPVASVVSVGEAAPSQSSQNTTSAEELGGQGNKPLEPNVSQAAPTAPAEQAGTQQPTGLAQVGAALVSARMVIMIIVIILAGAGAFWFLLKKKKA